MAKTKVTYVGLSDVRIMTSADLRKAGVEGDAGATKLEFHRHGPKREQEIEMDDKLEAILKADGGFKIASAGVEPNPEGEAEPEVVVDADSGAASKRK